MDSCQVSVGIAVNARLWRKRCHVETRLDALSCVVRIPSDELWTCNS